MSAFAQSTVTIGGTFDVGVKNVAADDATAKLSTINSNGAGTSLIYFSGSEDLGGGMKAEFKGQNVFSPVAPTVSNALTPYQSGGFFNDEVWAGVSGGFGALKFGAPSTATHVIAGTVVQPFATALGSGWESSGVSRLGAGSANKYGVNTYPGADYRIVRVEKSVRYDTPVFNGFSASYLYAFANNNSTTAASNTAGFAELAAAYANGPLNLNFAQSKVTVGSNGIAGPAAAATAGASLTAPIVATVFAAGASTTNTIYGGNYTAGPLTIYFGGTTAKGDGTVISTLNTKSTNYAAKYMVTPDLALAFNSIGIKDKGNSTAKDQSSNAFGVDYSLSKRTTAYARYVTYDTDKSVATKGVQVTAVGVKLTF